MFIHVILIHLPRVMHGIVSNATIDPVSKPASPAMNAESSSISRINIFLTMNLITFSPWVWSILEAILKIKLIKNKKNRIKIKKSNLKGVKIIASDKEISRKIR